RRAQVALAQIGQHHHDQLAGVLRPLADLHRRVRRRPAANAAQPALLARQLAGHRERVLVGHLHHLVDDADVEHAGDEAGADALNLVPPRLQLLALHLLRDHRAGHRLDRDRLETGLALLEDLADAGDGAAGADAADQDVRLAVGVAPDLFGRGLAVDLRV